MASFIFIFGVILVMTPAVIAIMDGVRDDMDIISWISSKPMDFIYKAQNMMLGGVGLILTGLCMRYLK